MDIDCSACKSVCKAACCSCSAPIEREVWERNKHRTQREIVEIIQEGAAIFALTGCLRCTFLTNELQCAIYDDRPLICQKFGDESHPFLTCSFINKNGRIRSRQERRKIERQSGKAGKQLKEMMEKHNDK